MGREILYEIYIQDANISVDLTTVSSNWSLYGILIADERVGVQVKLWNPLRTRAIPERFCGGDLLRTGAISSV